MEASQPLVHHLDGGKMATCNYKDPLQITLEGNEETLTC